MKKDITSASTAEIVSWKQLVVLIILCLATFAIFSQLDRYSMVSGNLSNPLLFTYQSDMNFIPANELPSEYSISLYSNQVSVVSAVQDIDVPPLAEYIKVSATITTENVSVGKNYWDGARLIFVDVDDKGNPYYHGPHLAGVVNGNVKNFRVSRVFRNNDTHSMHRIILELHNVMGKVTFSDIEVFAMNMSNNFLLMRITVGALWVVCIGLYIFSSVNRITRKGVMVSALFVMIALGALIPGDIKTQMNQSASSIICLLDFCNFFYVGQYSELVKYGFIFETGAINVFKFGHIFLFTLMSFILMWATDNGKCVKTLLFVLLIAAATEILQMMFITRTPSLHDMYIDVMGILIGLILSMLINRVVRRKKHKQVVDV